MTFSETTLRGVFEIRIDANRDERGFFARTWCRNEFEAIGLDSQVAQCSISFNTHKGTLRGMHFQLSPHSECKLVRCTRGSIYDVVLDLRAGSASFAKWIALELTADNRNMVYIPEGCAHGFLTLEDRSEVFYQMTAFYDADSARGVRWDDPRFQIAWPERVAVISERDRTYPDFQ